MLADRLKLLMEERGIDQSVVAAAMGVSQGAISLIAGGHTKRPRYLPALADYFGVPMAWLDGRSDVRQVEPVSTSSERVRSGQPDMIMIPLYDAPHGMGGGAFFEQDAGHEMMPFRKDWLRGKIAGRFDEVMMLPGRGDSMEPTIKSGDVLLVDRAQRHVREADLIWAFGYGQTGLIKRLRPKPAGGYVVQSDNKVVNDFDAAESEVHIVGRVVSILR